MHNPSATLLIIDDDDVVRASLAAYLDDSGFRVLQAPNGPKGLELFDSERPDLVICDHWMNIKSVILKGEFQK